IKEDKADQQKIDIDLSKEKRINLEKLTRDLEKIDPDILVSFYENDDFKKINYYPSDESKKELIEKAITDHSPQFTDQEEIDRKEQEIFDQKNRESLLRLGFKLPEKK